MTGNAAKKFLLDSHHALEHLYEALHGYYEALASAQKEVEDFERSKKALSDLFMYRDQWSPNANFHYARYVERMQTLDQKKNEAATKDQKQRLTDALAAIGATVESMSTVAGAVLQIAKQAIGLRHSGKPSLPKARKVGSQSIVEVIWEGRNHAMHWEEGAPKPKLQKMLSTLSSDFKITIEHKKNNCLSILGALGWTSPEKVVSDLNKLIE